MRLSSLRLALVLVLIGALGKLQRSEGIRFVIDRDECFSHDVKYEGDTVHVSFVVIKADSPWHYGDEGVDLVVCFFLFFFPLFRSPCILFCFTLILCFVTLNENRNYSAFLWGVHIRYLLFIIDGILFRSSVQGRE